MNKLRELNMRNKISILLITAVIFMAGCVPVKPFTPKENISLHKVPTLSKAQIFTKARLWYSEFFNSGKSVVDYEDRESGVIIGQGIANMGGFIVSESFKYSIKVEAKDTRYRVSTKVTQYLNSDSTNGTYQVNNPGKDRVDSVNLKLADTVKQLEAYILNSASKSDW